MTAGLPAKIAQRFRFVREIGRGPTGVVYEVLDEYTGARRALKLMSGAASDSRRVARFAREARLASVIGGEHVVRVFETDVATELGDRPFIVTELLTGQDLGTRMATGGPFSRAAVLAYLQQLADVLGRLHDAGIAHHALKPTNVFVHRDDDGRRLLKVLDFGIANLHPAPRTDASHREDLRAVAAIAAAMLAGEVSEAIEAWVVRSRARDPEEGFATASEQVDAFAEALTSDAASTPSGASVAPVAYEPADETPESSSRARVAASVSGGLALVLFGVLLGRAIFGSPAPPASGGGADERVAREVNVEVEDLVVPRVARTAPFDDAAGDRPDDEP